MLEFPGGPDASAETMAKKMFSELTLCQWIESDSNSKHDVYLFEVNG